MTPPILNLPAAPANGLPGAGAKGADAPPTDGDLFGLLLASRLHPVASPAAKADGAAKASGSASALQARIAALVKAGKSDAEIAATLAAELAAATAQALGAPDAETRSRLEALFAKAMAPPGGGSPPAPAADRIRTLAQRFLTVRTLAQQIVERQSHGQQIRIAGTFLDASPAKETPARTTTETDRSSGSTNAGASSGLPADALPHGTGAWRPASSQPGGSRVDASAPLTLPSSDARPPAPAIAPEAPVVAGDGRRVDLAGLVPRTTGGDTVLGRVLTRAAVADAARQPAAGADPAPASGSASETESAAVAAFVKSFAAALETNADPAAHAAPVDAAAAPGAAPAAPGAAPAFIPAVAPFAVERPVAPAAPAPPAVDQSAIVDQVLRGAFLRSNGASSEMRLTLVPETLGDVNVQLIVTAGDVAAHVVAQTPEVRDALVAAQPQLTKTLADAGLKLQSFTVDLSGSGFAGFSGNGGQPGQPNGGRPRAAAPDDDAVDPLDAVPSFAPSGIAAAGAGDYDYFA